MSKFVAVAVLAALIGGAAARADDAPMSSPVQLADNGNVNIITRSNDPDKTRPGYRPGYRPAARTIYMCVIDSDKQCVTSEQRVGGVCRCSNMTGSGRVVTR